MAEPLFGIFRDYHGNCDNCGAELHEPILLASDLREKDQYGNKLFFILGIPDKDNLRMGVPLTCKECGGRALVLRLYESADVTKLVTKQEVRNAL